MSDKVPEIENLNSWRVCSLVERRRWHEFRVSENESSNEWKRNLSSDLKAILLTLFLTHISRSLTVNNLSTVFNWTFLFLSSSGLAHVNSTFPSTNGSLTHYLPTATPTHRVPQHHSCRNSNSSKVISQK